MDIIGDGIDPFRDLVGHLAFLVNITVLKFVQVVEKCGEKAVENKLFRAGKFFGDGLPFRFTLKSNIGNLVDQPGENV